VEGEGGVKAMGPAIACPFEISGRAADVTNLRSPFNPPKFECSGKETGLERTAVRSRIFEAASQTRCASFGVLTFGRRL